MLREQGDLVAEGLPGRRTQELEAAQIRVEAARGPALAARIVGRTTRGGRAACCAPRSTARCWRCTRSPASWPAPASRWSPSATTPRSGSGPTSTSATSPRRRPAGDALPADGHGARLSRRGVPRHGGLRQPGHGRGLAHGQAARGGATTRDGRLLAGMFAAVQVLLPGDEQALALPRGAVLEDEGRVVRLRAPPRRLLRAPAGHDRARVGRPRSRSSPGCAATRPSSPTAPSC